ncbi:MAG TPA: hypothetical protein VF808_11805 [Ktedonobacterales bacterium]
MKTGNKGLRKGAERPRWSWRRRVAFIGAIGVVVVVAAGLAYGLYPRSPGIPTLDDRQVMRQVSFAYVTNDAVWVKLRGAQPRIVAHLAFQANVPYFHVAWSADQSLLLVSAHEEHLYLGPGSVDSGSAPQFGSWIVALPSGTITELRDPPGDCVLQSCVWFGDRFIIHSLPEQVFAPPTYRLYDIQTQVDSNTRLDNQPVYALAVRGQTVYFSSPPQSGQTQCSTGVIERFDVRSNTIATVFAIPDPYVDHNSVIAGWDVSADGARALVVTQGVAPSDNECQRQVAPHVYLLTQGDDNPIFSASVAASGFTLAPDGQFAAFTLAPDRTATPAAGASPEIAIYNAFTGDIHNHRLDAGAVSVVGAPALLGWLGQDAGVLSVVAQCASGPYDATPGATPLPTELTMLRATTIYYTPAGGSAPSRPIETISGPYELFFPYPLAPVQSGAYPNC